MSHAVRRTMYSRIVEEQPVDTRVLLKNYKRQITNPESRLMRYLKKQLLKQRDVIWSLHRKLELILEIVNNNTHTARDTTTINRDTTEIKICDAKNEEILIIGDATTSDQSSVNIAPRTNIVNLHIHQSLYCNSP